MIPKEYVQDKTKLALIGTIIALAVVVLIGLIYFVVAKKRFVVYNIQGHGLYWALCTLVDGRMIF